MSAMSNPSSPDPNSTNAASINPDQSLLSSPTASVAAEKPYVASSDSEATIPIPSPIPIESQVYVNQPLSDSKIPTTSVNVPITVTELNHPPTDTLPTNSVTTIATVTADKDLGTLLLDSTTPNLLQPMLL